MAKCSFTETDVKRLLRAVRKAGEIPDKVWVHRADGKTTLEIKIKNGADSDEVETPTSPDTWADVARSTASPIVTFTKSGTGTAHRERISASQVIRAFHSRYQ